MTGTLTSNNLSLDSSRIELDSNPVRAHEKPQSAAFADTLAQCATPLFTPWPPQPVARADIDKPSNNSISTRPTDQRRDRRQRSR
ncbi:MAG: hypothetical protein JWM78_636 [Verrucomicrobiaceae bacterium]|nr:hypothetical protein [Verrucomicrobiaceae bacterium]